MFLNVECQSLRAMSTNLQVMCIDQDWMQTIQEFIAETF